MQARTTAPALPLCGKLASAPTAICAPSPCERSATGARRCCTTMLLVPWRSTRCRRRRWAPQGPLRSLAIEALCRLLLWARADRCAKTVSAHACDIYTCARAQCRRPSMMRALACFPYDQCRSSRARNAACLLCSRSRTPGQLVSLPMLDLRACALACSACHQPVAQIAYPPLPCSVPRLQLEEPHQHRRRVPTWAAPPASWRASTRKWARYLCPRRARSLWVASSQR